MTTPINLLSAADYRRLLEADPAVIDIIEEVPGQPTPVLAAYDEGPGYHHLRVWCPHCREWHYHGRLGPNYPHQLGRGGFAGQRSAHHCHIAEPPYLPNGYVLDVIGLVEDAPRHRPGRAPWCPRCRHYYSSALGRCIACGRRTSSRPIYPALEALVVELFAARWPR